MSKPIDSSLSSARPARSDDGQTDSVPPFIVDDLPVDPERRVEFNYDYASPSEGRGMLLSELLDESTLKWLEKRDAKR